MSRIKIQLSRPTLLAFKEFKKLTYNDGEINATNGYILGIALKEILPIISSTNELLNLDLIDSINWVSLSQKNIPNVTNSDDTEIVRTRTTLTVEKSIDDSMNIFQNEFLRIFDSKRIYRAFVVKMILFAAIDNKNK